MWLFLSDGLMVRQAPNLKEKIVGLEECWINGRKWVNRLTV